MLKTTEELLTADDYRDLPEGPPHFQLVEGKLYMSPSPNFFHQSVAGNIYFLLRGYLKRHPRGKVAIANAKMAYQWFLDFERSDRWQALAAKGAQVQRPLWASTGTKNAAYSDVLYVEALVGPHTVNTLPPATLDAFKDHGKVARTVDADDAGAKRTIAELEALGIALTAVTDQLLVEGLQAFQKSFDSLLAGIESKMGVLGR